MDNVIQFDNATSGAEMGNNSQAFYKARTMWIDELNKSGVSDRAFRVGYFIAMRMSGEYQSSRWPIARIAAELNVSTDKVKRAVKELKHRGFLAVKSGKRGTANVYRLRGQICY